MQYEWRYKTNNQKSEWTAIITKRANIAKINMKNEISSLELMYLVKELKVLENSKVDRIYNSKDSKNEFLFAFHISGEGKHFLKIRLPSLIFMSRSKDGYETMTGFGMMLRKYLEGGFLKSIEQKDFERVLELKFDSKKEGKLQRFNLIIELFSKGNVIFCDEKYKILNLMEEQHWSARELKRNEIYIFPKSKNKIINITKNEFKETIKNSEKESVVKSLAMDFSLGGKYAEEICLNAGVEKSKKCALLTDNEINNVYKQFSELFNKKIKANFVSENIFPFELEAYKNIEKQYYDTFSTAIEENYNKIKIDKSAEKKKEAIEKIKLIISDQEKVLLNNEKEYAELQKQGEFIYEHYSEINNILGAVKKGREKYSWKEIKEKLKSDPKLRKLIKEINEKNNEIVVEIE